MYKKQRNKLLSFLQVSADEHYISGIIKTIMKQKYLPKEFETPINETWSKEEVYKTSETDDKEKMYTLVMFPYPSGAGLHVGHVRVYTGIDVLARYYRMKGYNVLNPMGWDAFGLPAENAAIKEKKNPIDIVPRNIDNFRRQMQMCGFSFDWSREFATTDPNYYKWTQYLFIQFYKMGLLYKKNTPVYFCEFCKTGLAEEEVLPDGTHERCGKQITRKELPQWIFRITTYADRLIDDLKGLDWPTGILEMQKNWIGKQKGLNIDFKTEDGQTFTVWTKYWETLFGVTFMVVAPEHPWVQQLVQSKNAQEVIDYVKKALSKTDEQRLKDEKEKTGVFTGKYAINPVNGQKVPIWVADYVLAGVGTGAVMGVPAHDERDFAFVKKYNLPIIQVVKYEDKELDEKVAKGETYHEGEGVLVNSGEFNGQQNTGTGKQKMAEWMIEQKFASWNTSYHLRDWIFSRQRYWGEPIPMVHCQTCADKKISYWDTEESKSIYSSLRANDSERSNPKQEREIASSSATPRNDVRSDVEENVKAIQSTMYGWFPIEEKTLPLELPYMKSYEPSGTGESPLSEATEWVKTTCPHCGSEARRETDTMPNWAGSCWYFLRFADPKNDKEPWSPEALKKWEPVDWYVGGAEHAVLHLLYARFWIKALYDLKMVSFKEPFLRLRNVGMVLAEDHRKMSKSWGNVINPDDVVGEYGADTLRVYEMFMAPFNQEIAWSTSTLQGAYRFLQRVYYFYTERDFFDELVHEDKQLIIKLNKTIAKVGGDIPEIKYNTAIASMMEFLNEWDRVAHHHSGKAKSGKKRTELSRDHARAFLKILAPFAPFLADYLWREVMGEKSSIHISPWPQVDEAALHQHEIRIPVQVNGKVRKVITIPAADIEKEKVVRHAEENEKVKKYIQGKIYEAVYVRGKIINFVLKD